jgi:hypothetical protein
MTRSNKYRRLKLEHTIISCDFLLFARVGRKREREIRFVLPSGKGLFDSEASVESRNQFSGERRRSSYGLVFVGRPL